jgi:glycosyltransferase involved in cell wall biosynthesis
VVTAAPEPSPTAGRDFRRSDRVRVVINAIHAKSGGGVTHLRNLLPYLAEDERLETHVFLHVNQYHQFDPIDDRVRVHLFDFIEGFMRTLFWEQIVVPVMARSMRADVTFSLANYGPLFAPRPVIMLRNALSVVGRERRFWKRVYWVGLAIMTMISLLSSRHAIAVSEYSRRALTFGLKRTARRKVTVVYHGVDDVFSPPDGGTRKSYLLAVSDIYVQKNFHTLIQALAIARRRCPDLCLKVAGRPIDEGYFAEVAETVRRSGLEDAVEFLGPLSKESLRRHYRECAVFVFPSTTETFGHPLVEAMASAAPIASSNRTAMPEILGAAGEYFDPLDPTEMADAIVRIILDPDLARTLGERGRRQARRFSWRRSARKTADVLVAVAAGATSPEAT